MPWQRVALHELETGYRVSTVSIECGMYETMVFNPRGSEAFCKRTDTHAHALDNHASAVAKFS